MIDKNTEKLTCDVDYCYDWVMVEIMYDPQRLHADLSLPRSLYGINIKGES